MGKRILVSVCGSGGDLFPLMPVLLRLRADGHDIVCAAPRLLSLYLSPLRFPVVTLGKGVELDVLHDLGRLTTRFDGWSAARFLLERHVMPSLPDDVAEIERSFATDGRPDLVVTTFFATAARIAAHRHGIPRVDLSIYPTVVAMARRSTGFGAQFRTRCAEIAGLGDRNACDELVTELAWGVGRDTVLLHDPAILRLSGFTVPSDAIGFPYWDAAVRRPDEETAVVRWLEQAGDPAVLVTMGSYLGTRQTEFWEEVVRTVDVLGIRAVLLGPRRELNAVVGPLNPACFPAGFVRLSQIAGKVTAMVHHGGVGTMFAALSAGSPAVVVPRFFDQPFNARLVEAAGTGLAAEPATLHLALERVLAERGAFEQRATEVSRMLVPADHAVERAIEAVTARL